jgi:hypothetical protein
MFKVLFFIGLMPFILYLWMSVLLYSSSENYYLD